MNFFLASASGASPRHLLRRSATTITSRQMMIPSVCVASESAPHVYNNNRPSSLGIPSCLGSCQQQLQHVRYFGARKKKKRPKLKNPWKVLGIKESDNLPFKKVKMIFLQIAMKNHPDTHEAETEEEAKKMEDTFVKARTAFECLTEGPDGIAIRKEDYEDTMENFDSWFKQETGHDTPFSFMDPETMKEVAKMTEEVGQGDQGGLDRDGGMWALARMVRSTVKAGGDAGAMLRLESGNVKEQNIGGGLRRKRRR
jgi:hypothetical protein